jgi:hypothetical protein
MEIVRRTAVVLLMVFAIAKPEARVQPAATVELTALRFLVGEWEAIETSPGERGGFTFSLGVQDRVMTRTNHAIYDARDGRPASRHDDLMVIYVESGTIKADYFDSEQHVIRYVVQRSGDRQVTFVSEPHASEPRYRLSYAAQPDGSLAGRFEIAAPGASEFKPYLSWTARKRR